jgi:hypothetical protein
VNVFAFSRPLQVLWTAIVRLQARPVGAGTVNRPHPDRPDGHDAGFRLT